MAPTAAEDVPVTKKARIEEPKVPSDVAALKEDIVNLQATIQKIEEIEDEINQIEDKQSEAIIKLEQEFVKQKVPHYSKRAEQIKTIPNFWSKACQQHPQIYCLITDEDKKAFEYLTEIIVDPVNKEGTGKNQFDEVVSKTLNFVIHFKFKENPFFENAELVKKFYQLGEDVVSEGEEIKWKEGNNLVAKQAGNTEANGDAATNGNLTESFFAWFSDHDDAENDETADAIKEDLYLHALNYYLNEESDEEDDDEQDDDQEIDLNSEDE